jgi:hypothetical protein
VRKVEHVAPRLAAADAMGDGRQLREQLLGGRVVAAPELEQRAARG